MKTNPTILIVEDEQKIAALLRDYFAAENFNVYVLGRGDQVLPFIKNSAPDLILLDLMLPGTDGMDVCRQIRKEFDIPIIILTARVEETDVLAGLHQGADDYICKPFSPKEVVARVYAVLRRTGMKDTSLELRIGPVFLDGRTRQVKINGHDLTLTPTEYGILEILMGEPGTIFSRELLLDKVLGYRFEGYNRTIDTHIKNLRKKISNQIPDEQVIISVYAAGYKFNPALSA